MKIMNLNQLKVNLLATSRLTKQLIASFVDFSSICLAILLGLIVSDQNIINLAPQEFFWLIWIPFFAIIILAIERC